MRHFIDLSNYCSFYSSLQQINMLQLCVILSTLQIVVSKMRHCNKLTGYSIKRHPNDLAVLADGDWAHPQWRNHLLLHGQTRRETDSEKQRN
jgi:hypothetical protein